MKNCPTCQHTYADDVDFCPHDGTHLDRKASPCDGDLAAQLASQFTILRCLGTGGMGTVYLAEQLAVGNRLVALKVLARGLLDDPEFLQRFRNEAGSAGRICHPNVVTIYESGEADDGTPFIAMEYLEGQTVRQWIEKQGPTPALECAEILWQAARGLNAAHKLGILHRDLKPDNIFLTHDGEGELLVKLVDFGVARLRESSNKTVTGALLGTPAYMSFEQASGMRSEELDARSDIYSLGVVVYEMLAGCLPFESDTPIGFISKHITESPMSFRVVKPDLPGLPGIERAVMKALAKNREIRYACALDFAREFAAGANAVIPGESDEQCATPMLQSGIARPPEPELSPPRPAQQPRREGEQDVSARLPAPATAAAQTVKLFSRAAAAAAGSPGPVSAAEPLVARTPALPPPPAAPGRDAEVTAQSAPEPHSAAAPAARPQSAVHNLPAGKLPRAHAVVQYKERKHWGHVFVLFILLAALLAGAIWLLAPKIRKLSSSSQRQMHEGLARLRPPQGTAARQALQKPTVSRESRPEASGLGFGTTDRGYPG